MAGNRAQLLFMLGRWTHKAIRKRDLVFSTWRAMYDDDDNGARKPSTPGWSTWHGKCNQSTTRVGMYLMVLGTGKLSQTSRIDWHLGERGREGGDRT